MILYIGFSVKRYADATCIFLETEAEILYFLKS